MEKSILTSTKKALGLAADYDAFDSDIIMHVNDALSTLTQIGVGPAEGFAIEDAEATWDDFLGGEIRLNSVPAFVYVKTKILFDPPSSPPALTAMEKQAEEKIWRIQITANSIANAEGA